jgi:hypothetical protein
MGYKIGATANGTATVRATLDAARTYRFLVVMQFRPDAGDTVAYDAGDSPANGLDTACQTGNISTTGDDEVVVSFYKQYSGTRTVSNVQIADAAADGQKEDGVNYNALMWYKLFTATQSNIHGQLTFNTSARWLADIVAFKSTAAGGATIYPPAFGHDMRGVGVGVARGIGR